MAYRRIDTNFWADEFVENLSPHAKLVFLYSFTNNLCNQAGVYEISLKRMAFETGLTLEELKSALQEISEKVVYFEEEKILWVKNFIKWQSQNPSFLKSAYQIIENLPEYIKKVIMSHLQKTLHYHSTVETQCSRSTHCGYTVTPQWGHNGATHPSSDTDTDTETENKIVVSNDTTCPQAKPVDGSNINPSFSNEEKHLAAKTSSKDCPHQEIINLYHEILPELPGVKVWNETRRKLLRARWREDPQRQNLEWWRKFFLSVRECPFLMGQVVTKDGRTFQADLEWLIRPQNFAKVLEGRYRQKGWEGKVSSITLHNLRAAQEFLRKYEGEENEDS